MKSRILLVFISLIAYSGLGECQSKKSKRVTTVLRDQIMQGAAWALDQQPVTVTSQGSTRSAGTSHDFFSEGDYWWPDSTNLDGPYVQRDGLTNPENFTAHRLAMIRFSKIIGSLSSAWLLTNDDKYVKHAIVHFKAWFISPETLMNPNLQFAQAIKGRVTGRGIGIIDTIQLMEVAQGALRMSESSTFDQATFTGVLKWFAAYIDWLMTHPYGKEEMEAKNNHGTCWVMQVAAFAKLTNNKVVLQFCRDRYKNVLLPNQMAEDGSFPLELKRTKPYGYSIFNLDAMVMICQILSDKQTNLWKAEVNGKSIFKGINFLYPFLNDKSKWPYAKDVMYWNDWPVAPPSLVMGSIAFNKNDWFETWKKLDHDPKQQEVIRNLPVRHPTIWIY